MSEADLGPCCICEKEGPDVRNIVMMPFKAPIPGRGWGCFICGLPPDGASIVLCDECLESYDDYGRDKLKYICTGYPAKDGRTPYEGFPQVHFDHIFASHDSDEGDYVEI